MPFRSPFYLRALHRKKGFPGGTRNRPSSAQATYQSLSRNANAPSKVRVQGGQLVTRWNQRRQQTSTGIRLTSAKRRSPSFLRKNRREVLTGPSTRPKQEMLWHNDLQLSSRTGLAGIECRGDDSRGGPQTA